MEDRLVSVEWAAAYCSVSKRTIRRWIQDGTLTPLRQVGGAANAPVRFRESDVRKVYVEVPAESVG